MIDLPHIILSIFVMDVTIALLLASYAWQHRGVPGANSFIGLMVCAAWWTGTSALSMIGPTETWAAFWEFPTKYFAVVWVPVFFLRFVMEYTRRTGWLESGLFRIFYLVPLMAHVISLVVPHWFFEGVVMTQQNGLWLIEQNNRHPFFWVQLMQGDTLMLGGFILLLDYVRRTRGFHRQRTLMVLAGALLPFAGNFVSIFFLPEMGGSEITATCFTLGAIIWAYALFRFKFLNLMPIAYEAVVQSMSDAVIVLDTQNRLVELNPPAEVIIRRSARDVIGKSIETVFQHRAELVRTYTDVQEIQTEINIKSATGETRYFDMKISTLYDRANHNAGRLLVLRDITARKRAEIEREQLIQDLNAYAYSVAHDLKTPLGVVMGYVQLLIMEDPQKPLTTAQKYFKRILSTTEQMEQIIDALLLLASLRETTDVPLETLDMKQLITKAQEQLENMINEKGAKITITGDLPTAIGYAPWITAVWTNYLSNAIKYGGTPPMITIDSNLHENQVRFWVRDNGGGLTPEQKVVVFMKFSRFAPEKAEGHGLGLSIVQRVVEKLGGTVGVESTQGEGAAFYFTLPASRDL